MHNIYKVCTICQVTCIFPRVYFFQGYTKSTLVSTCLIFETLFLLYLAASTNYTLQTSFVHVKACFFSKTVITLKVYACHWRIMACTQFEKSPKTFQKAIHFLRSSLPAVLTVEVDAFCSWSIWIMRITSRALANKGSTSYLSDGTYMIIWAKYSIHYYKWSKREGKIQKETHV